MRVFTLSARRRLRAAAGHGFRCRRVTGVQTCALPILDVYKRQVNGTAMFDGLVTFAPGQTFPGAGSGTVTSITAGSGLTASSNPITTSGTLSIAPNLCPANQALIAFPFACSPFATLGTNTFTANQTVSGSLSVTGAGSFSAGVSGVTSTVSGNAVYGYNSATSGSGTNGVYGTSSSPSGSGVVGVDIACLLYTSRCV